MESPIRLLRELFMNKSERALERLGAEKLLMQKARELYTAMGGGVFLTKNTQDRKLNPKGVCTFILGWDLQLLPNTPELAGTAMLVAVTIDERRVSIFYSAENGWRILDKPNPEYQTVLQNQIELAMKRAAHQTDFGQQANITTRVLHDRGMHHIINI